MGSIEPVNQEILFLGTGIMGAPMARRLGAAGISVAAWNRTAEKAAGLAGAGVRTVQDLRDLSVKPRIVIVMLSTGEVVDQVLFGPAAGCPAVEILAPGSVVIVMSSISVESALQQAERLQARGIEYVDAPVSGGERGAIAGTLTIMAGGGADTCQRIAPVLTHLGTMTRVGAVGSGQLSKLANQLIVGISIGAVAEALVLAELGGADPRAVYSALQGGFADSTVLRQHGARMLERRFDPGAHCTTQLKDLSTALALGNKLGGAFPLLALCNDLYAALCKSSRQSLDHSALYLDARDRTPLGSTDVPELH